MNDKTKEFRIKPSELIKFNDKEYTFKDLVNLYLSKFEKPNHKIYRSAVKKVKRQYFRQKNGVLRDQLVEKFNSHKVNDPVYKKLREEEEEIRKEKEIRQKEKEDRIWLERERLAEIQFRAKKEKLDRERQEEEEEEAKKQETISKDKEILQKVADSHVATHNPSVTLVQAKEPEKCFFYKKTGICKYGIRCDKSHDLCEKSSTLLFVNMYSGLQQLYSSLKEDYECDTSLEYEDKEIYTHFKEFYKDVLSEFKSIGEVTQFKVCCNYQTYLRGNVYVQFKSEDDAVKAFHTFNGRFYGGKQIYCNFVTIPLWKEAICGLFLHKKCPKGRNCGFLHVFKDPDNEFRNANNDRINNIEERKQENNKITSYQVNEWSSPEIHDKKKRSRSSSRDSHRRHKKHKKKEHKKKKRKSKD